MTTPLRRILRSIAVPRLLTPFLAGTVAIGVSSAPLPSLLASAAQGQAPDAEKMVLTNVAGELARCAAFYGLMATALENSGEAEGAKRADKMTRTAIEWSAMAIGQAGLKDEVLLAWVKLSREEFLRRIDDDLTNLAILMADADVGGLCPTIMSDPSSRVEYWVQQEFGR